MPARGVCVIVGVSVSVCVKAPLPPCSFGSPGNVTPVPGIAASLDPGSSNDRNRLLLPLWRTHCLATGSPHTHPKAFLKPSSSFANVPAFLLFSSLAIIPLPFLHVSLNVFAASCHRFQFSVISPSWVINA
ncbi:hypothetical protein XENORESO_018794 [Xenotaenia resolanae]|uniref:Secreted protein n=1 Tax=Xenotaenia resolanae TaxID=208358 RepID=A0ABV0WH67_9TELE